jgi:hypothetical protein
VVRRAVLGTVGATEKAAEEFACGITADEEFRRASHEMIRRRSQVLLDDLLTTPPHPRHTATRRAAASGATR